MYHINDDVSALSRGPFEENRSYFIDKEETSIPERFTLGSMAHRLFHVSSDIDDESKHGYDHVYNLIQKKVGFQRGWHYKRNIMRRRNLSSVFENLEKQIDTTRKDSCLQVPKYIPCFTEVAKEDPDEAFSGKYNWYYTGGCLRHLRFNDNHYLAYVGGKRKDNLHIAPLKCDDQLWCIEKSGVQNVTASPGKEIFQVVHVEKPNNNYLGVRQKDTCLVYKYSENGRIVECFNLESHVPIASLDLSSVHEELCIIDVKQGLSFWDIHRKDLPMSTYFPSDNPRCDNWHNLLYSADPSVISLAGRKSLKWMDRRSSNVTNSMKLADLKGVLKEEEISVHFASECNPHLIYVCTDINLFLLDVRSPSSAVQCWTHYLSSPPLYSCVIPCGEENEIVCIGNQYPGNVVFAFSNKSNNWPLVEIPSRWDSLLSLHASGLCLDPSVKPRMTLGLTGLTYLKCDHDKYSNVEILTQTVASDIFSQSLFDKNTEVISEDLDELVSTKESLQATERWNMRKFYNKLSKGAIELNIPKKMSTGRQPWQLSKQELLEYKDVLSSLILEEWDVGGVDGKCGISGEHKVNAWLDSSFKTVYTTQERHFAWEDE